jgi:hypothetical protein
MPNDQMPPDHPRQEAALLSAESAAKRTEHPGGWRRGERLCACEQTRRTAAASVLMRSDPRVAVKVPVEVGEAEAALETVEG